MSVLGPPRSRRRRVLLALFVLVPGVAAYVGAVALGFDQDSAGVTAAAEAVLGFAWASALLTWAAVFAHFRWACAVNYLWREAGRPSVPWRPPGRSTLGLIVWGR